MSADSGHRSARRLVALLGVAGTLGAQPASILAAVRVEQLPAMLRNAAAAEKKRTAAATKTTTPTATTPAPVQTTPAPVAPAPTTTTSDPGATIGGPVVVVRSWGNVQVTITFTRTTVSSGTQTSATLNITDCSATGPDHTSRSAFISAQAIPALCQETLAAQSSNIHTISGATDTSKGFVQSLQAAITQATA